MVLSDSTFFCRSSDVNSPNGLQCHTRSRYWEYWDRFLQLLGVPSRLEDLLRLFGRGFLGRAWQCASPVQVRGVAMHPGRVTSFSAPKLTCNSLVAELVSAYPTAGGMYFVTKHVVPKEHVAIWAWIIGWCNFLGQAAGVASLAYTIAQMILASATMNSNLVDDTYSYTPYVPDHRLQCLPKTDRVQ